MRCPAHMGRRLEVPSLKLLLAVLRAERDFYIYGYSMDGPPANAAFLDVCVSSSSLARHSGA